MVKEKNLPSPVSSLDTPEEIRHFISCLLEKIDEPIYVVDLTTYKTLYANKAMKSVYGKELEGKKKWTGFFSESSLDKMLMHPCNRRHSPEKTPDNCEALYLNRVDKVKAVNIASTLLPGTGKSVLSLLDITKRRQLEEKLRESQLLIQRIADATPDILYVYDLAEQRIVYINKQVTAILGYTPEEAEKTGGLEDLPSPASFADFIKKTAALVENAGEGEVIKFEYQLKHANGEQRWLYNRAVFYKPADGLTRQILGSAQDITTHKLTEKRIRDYQEQLRSLASELILTEERERRRIAMELHDHIGQSLAVAKIKLGALLELLKDTGLEEQVEEIRGLIEQSIGYTRSLTFDLSPAILYELGFEAALEWLCEQTQSQNLLAVEFRDDRQPKPLGDELRILLFRVVRELLHNVAKHADAGRAAVSMQRDGNKMRITVQDDGRGFDPNGLSVTGGFGLFSIREQVKHLGGHLRIESSPGNGSKFTLVAPLRNQTSNEESI